MKKLIILISLVVISLSANAQRVVNGCIVTMKESTNRDFSYKSDTIDVSFSPAEHFWRVHVKNKIANNISLVWDKSLFVINGESSKITFNDDLNSASIIPNGAFISKEIYPTEYLDSLTPTISKRFVKKRYDETGKPDTIKIVLSFVINGNTKEYEFNFSLVPKA